MRIKNLHIGEFGIFRNQQMDDISPEIVLVAGPNRAGKTTFMQLLRYLAYPFPRTGEIPSQVGGYRIQADYTNESGQYILYREGLSEPRLITRSGEEEIAVEDYFIDGFTYSQLFTLSLDELRKVPHGVENRQLRHLQSVLLGAGLADLAVLPEVIQSFRNQAHNIGGKLGSPSVSEFKPYNQQIRQGIQLRNTAKQEVEEYERISKDLKETIQLIHDMEKEKDGKALERDRLEVLKTSYSLFQKQRLLNSKLSNSDNQQILESFPEEKYQPASEYLQLYPERVRDFQEKRDALSREITERSFDERLDFLIRNREQLREWERNISGVEQRVREVTEIGEKQEKSLQQLENKIHSLRSDLPADSAILENISLDEIAVAALRKQIRQYELVTNKRRDLENDLEDIQTAIAGKKAALDDEQEEQHQKNVKIIGAASILGIVAGLLLGLFTEPWIGIVSGVGLVVLLSGIFVVQFFYHSEFRRLNLSLRQDIDELVTESVNLKQRIHQQDQSIKEIDILLNNYRKTLSLPDNTTPDLIENIFLELRNLKNSYLEWKSTQAALHEKKKNIQGELRRLAILLDYDLHIAQADLYTVFRQLKSELNQAVVQLQMALDFTESRKKREELESEIQQLLMEGSRQLTIDEVLAHPSDFIAGLEAFVDRGDRYFDLRNKKQEMHTARESIFLSCSDRVGQAFGLQEKPDESEYIDLLQAHYEDFLNEEDIQRKYQEVQNELETLNKTLSEKQDLRSRLQKSLEDLATSEKLEKAQEQIDAARSQLEPLAREFAINQIAGYLLEKVRDQYLESTRGQLLEKASQYFKRLTRDTYDTILPPEGLESANFIARRGDVTDQQVDILSRGTREQLFFAVRLSRIMELPPLPVIFDDSFVNFDVQHRQQAAKIVGELSSRNQVFVLTCHPEIIEYVAAGQQAEIQYWLLDQGKINPAEYDSVQEALKMS